MRAAEIVVAGGATERIETRVTRWGPVVAEDWLGRPLALHATWLEPQGLDLDIVGVAAATDVASASALLGALGGTVAELGARRSRRRTSRWVVNGPLPRRVGFDGSRPESLADGSRSWQGQAAAAGRARRPRRRAVHGQQPHAAARACRRRQPHVDAAAAREAHRRSARGAAARSTSATSSRCSSTRAPKATSRSAPRFSKSSRRRTRTAAGSERASSRATGTAMPTSTSRRSVSCTRTTARCSSARSSRC